MRRAGAISAAWAALLGFAPALAQPPAPAQPSAPIQTAPAQPIQVPPPTRPAAPEGPAPAAAGDPAPPVSDDPLMIRAWLENNVREAGWARLGVGQSSHLMAPNTFVKVGDKVATFLRVEYFEPVTQNNYTFRSALQAVQFDCQAKTYVLAYVMLYRSLNLEGSFRGNFFPNPPSNPAGSGPMGAIMEVACATPLTAWPTEARAPVDTSRAGVMAWLAENIDAWGWRVLAVNDSTVFMVAPMTATTSEGWAQARTRSEFRALTTTEGVSRRSEEGVLQADCPSGRARVVNGIPYPQQNLKGEGRVREGASIWTAPNPGSVLDTMARMACGQLWRPAAGTPGATAPPPAAPARPAAAPAASSAP